jgi:hypothetical protein
MIDKKNNSFYKLGFGPFVTQTRNVDQKVFFLLIIHLKCIVLKYDIFAVYT